MYTQLIYVIIYAIVGVMTCYFYYRPYVCFIAALWGHSQWLLKDANTHEENNEEFLWSSIW